MPDNSNTLYTSHVRRATLSPDNVFRFEGKICGLWSYNDSCLIIDFRADGGTPTYIHIFMKCNASDCWRLIKKGNAIYDAFASKRHNNEDDEIVLLLKVPEKVGIDE